ncbi:hypothetical protein SVIOM342S_05555 [Streptomyces violaceorubidus]
MRLSEVRIRYYFKADSPSASYRFACSWAVRGCAAVTGTFGTLGNPTATADRYLEIGFTAAAGTLAPGADTGDLQLRFHQSNWQTLRQSDDYSFGGGQTSYANWDRVTAQLAGATVWGTAPEGNDPTDPTDPTDPPGGGQSLFDDFDYGSHADPALSAHGWSVRSDSGGPGVPGATWDPSKRHLRLHGRQLGDEPGDLHRRNRCLHLWPSARTPTGWPSGRRTRSSWPRTASGTGWTSRSPRSAASGTSAATTPPSSATG